MAESGESAEVRVSEHIEPNIINIFIIAAIIILTLALLRYGANKSKLAGLSGLVS